MQRNLAPFHISMGNDATRKQANSLASETLIILVCILMIGASLTVLYKKEPVRVEREIAPLSFRVLTFNRPVSLQRLLYSLSNLGRRRQDNTSVDLYIYVDSKNTECESQQRQQRDIIRVKEITESFQWHLGNKEIHYRTVHHGLRNQWLAAWYPVHLMAASGFFEDDIEVSSQFLEYVEKILSAIANRRKGLKNNEEFDQCGGIITEELRINDHCYPTTCTENKQFMSCFRVRFTSSWGPIYFGTFWKHFMDWYWTVTWTPHFKPYTTDNNGDRDYNLWLRQGKDVWSPWLKRFLEETDYWFIYCKPPRNNTVWLRNYRDIGVNTQSYREISLPRLFSGDLSSFEIPCIQSRKLHNETYTLDANKTYMYSSDPPL